MEETANVNLYIFDSHRPIHHNNIHASRSIVVVDDGLIPPIDRIPDQRDFELANMGEEEASEQEDNFDPNNLDEGEGEEDETKLNPPGSKSEKAQLTREYYSSFDTGKAVAGVMYNIAWERNKQCLDFFWYWVLGITDQFLHSRISLNIYEGEL